MHHETRNTTEVLRYCSTCGRRTMHRVFDRKVAAVAAGKEQG